MAKRKLSLHAVESANNNVEPLTIAKPRVSRLDKFKSKKLSAIANVGTDPGALPHYPIAHAKDFVRLHPDEEAYWSDEYCFVSIPIKGTKKDSLHFIDEDIALEYLGKTKKLLRFRLALATKPFDIFFLCQVPSTNLDNSWNISALSACKQAKTQWVQASSRKEEGAENYKIDYARDPDAFPEVKWPKKTLDELVEAAFNGRMIESADHPGLLRLIGAKQSVS